MRLNFHDKMNLARAGEQERERVAGIAQRHIEHRAEVDRAIMLAEYAQHGLTPPEPLHSLKFMMTLGWHIEQYGDRNVLVRPERIMKKKDEPAAKAELNDDIPF
jgi:hypothetical protein